MRVKLVKIFISSFLIVSIAVSVYLGIAFFLESSRAQDLRAKADAGDSASQLLLGKHYAAKKDYREAIAWLTKSADQGNDQAINQIGILVYLLGSGAASEENKSLSLALEEKLEKYRQDRPVIEIYKADLKRGNLERLHEIGEIYYFGGGVKKDPITARGYFERSSAANVSNSAGSEFRLGEIYLFGSGVIADKQVAVKWFEKSCGRPNAQACEKLKTLR